MCLETIETKVSTDPTGSQSSQWLPVVKAFLNRFSGPATSAKETDANESEESLPSKLTKLVGEASGKIATASGSLFANIAATTSTTTKKAIEGINGTELPVVAWEFPALPVIKQDTIGSWSSIIGFWEQALFGKQATDSADTYYSEMESSEDTADCDIDVTVEEKGDIDGESGILPAQPSAETDEAEIVKLDAVQENHDLASNCEEVGLGVGEQRMDSKPNSPIRSTAPTTTECPSSEDPNSDVTLYSSAPGTQQDQVTSPSEEEGVPLAQTDDDEENATVPSSATS